MTHQRFGIGVAVGLVAFLAGAVAPQAAPGAAQAQAATRQLEVSFNNGKVTVIAENVTLREILTEWGRKGGSRIVNADKLGGSPVPYTEFRDMPEASVLRSLLRDVPGYGAAPRIAPSADASAFDAVFILATRTVPVSGASSSPMAPQIQPAPLAPQGVPRAVEGSVDSEIPPVRTIQGDLPPTTPGGGAPANDPTLRTAPGGMVTSTIPGVVIPGAPTTGTPPPNPTNPTTGGRGRGGRGGGGGGGQR
jgi:hypothetical protein